MKVKANKNFESIMDATIGRTRRAGEVWEVTEARANLLLEHNLVSIVPEEKSEVVVVPEVVVVEQKPKKPRAKKKN